jgi:membrane protein DedA with SNARE-associated domain
LTSFLAQHGLWAVFVLMAIDAVFPAASELVMLYAGALASGALAHDLNVFGSPKTGFGAYLAIALAGTLGYLVGALAGWAIGFYGGRPFFERHGRWFHLSQARLERAEQWFHRWEGWAVFVGRITPIARSFISIPAGILEARLGRYTILTLLGSAIWCFAWAGVGWALGESWHGVDKGFRYVEYLIVAGIVVAVGYLILRHRRSTTMARRADSPR